MGRAKGGTGGGTSIGRQKEKRENVLVVCRQWQIHLPASAACVSTAGCPRPSLNHISSVPWCSLLRAAWARVGKVLVVHKRKRIRKAYTHSASQGDILKFYSFHNFLLLVLKSERSGFGLAWFDVC